MSSEANVKDKDAQSGGIMDTLRVIIHALLLAVFIRIFLYQPFNIPSGSMIPTLLVGDYLFVSKFSYGYSRHAFPWSPNLFDGRIFGSDPERGDVAVFKLPSNDSENYIKRVIGLPGDRVQMIEGVLHINGEGVKRERIEDFVGPRSACESGTNYSEITVPRYMETLPNGVTYESLDCRTNSGSDDTREFVVPEDHFFMMGDNRDNSSDSRSPRSGVGYVPRENLIGRADVIFFSIDETASWFAPWRWPVEIRWSRFFDLIN
jgi:signal peptidase I